MKRILLIVLLLIVLVIGGGVAAFYLTPSDVIARAAADQARQATGRELTINGAIERTLYPTLGVKTGPVTLSNPDWAENPSLVSAKSAEIGVKLLPLLTGALEIQKIELIEPQVALEVSEDGEQSWVFETGGAAGGGGRASGTDVGPAGREAEPLAVTLGEASIVDGAFSYLDRQSGQELVMTDIDATASLPSIENTLSVDLEGTVNEQRARFSGAIDSPGKAQRGEEVLADVTFGAEGVSFGFNGAFRAPLDGSPPEASGDLAFSLDEDPELTGWLRSALPPELAELGGVDVTGKLAVDAEQLDVDLSGDAGFKGKTTQIVAKAKAGAGWMEGAQSAEVEVSAKNDLLDAGYVGLAGLTESGAPLAKGAVRAKLPSAKALMDWAGAAPEAESPLAKLDSLDLDGEVDVNDTTLSASLAGDVGYNGRVVAVETKASGGPDWQEGGVVETAATARSQGFFEGAWDGTVRLADAGPTVAGDARFATEALRELVDWAGAGPVEAPSGTFETLSFEAGVETAPEKSVLKQAVITLDDTEVTADVTVETGGERPKVTAALVTGPLDLRPFTQMASGGGSSSGGGSGGASAGGGSGGSGGGSSSGRGWSEEPLQLDAMKLVDADVDIDTEGVTTNVIRVGKSRLKVVLDNGRLETTLSEMALYSGSATGSAVVDARTTPSIDIDMKVASVQLRPLLNDTSQIDWLEGTGNFDLDIQGQGASEKALMSSLDGSSSMLLTNGAIIGYNLAALVRNVTSLGTASGDTEKTDFAEMSGSFVIKDGVATNNDFRMLGPLVRLTGSGTVNIGQQTLNYRLVPKAVASLKGQGGDAGLRGLSFPLLVTGYWGDPSIQPDLAGGLENIESLGDVLGGALEGGGDIGKALEDVTGGGDGEGLSESLGGALKDLTGDDKIKKPKDVLKGLFGD